MAEKRVIEYEAASAVENDDWLLLDGVTEGTRKIRPSVMNGDITSAITTLQGDVGDLADNFAEEYDSSESYAVGDYCTHENILYVCTGATTGTWDGTKWTSTDVAEIVPTDLADLQDDSTHRVVTDTEKSTWSGKQDALTFDDVPTEDSDNPVKSGGIYEAIEEGGKVKDVKVDGTSVVDTNKVAQIDLTGKADVDGIYDELVAGNVMSDSYESDTTPYLYRASHSGSAVEEEIVGGSIAWNQLVSPISEFSTYRGSKSVSDGVLTYTTTEAGSSKQIYKNGVIVAPDHVVFCSCSLYPTKALQSNMSFGNNNFTANFSNTANIWNRFDRIIKVNSNATSEFSIYIDKNNILEVGDVVKCKNCILIDLTQAFGTAIADYIYSLEQATAGSGIAWLKSYGFLTKDYYAYDSGSLQSVNVASRKVVGKNLCPTQESAWEQGSISSTTGEGTSSTTRLRTIDYYPIKNDTDYHITARGGYCFVNILFYDTNKTYIGDYYSIYALINGATDLTINIPSANLPNVAYYKTTIRNVDNTSTVVAHDIEEVKPQIELGSTSTTYEPYKTKSYPLDSNLTLRGVPKKDANGKLYYDGDVYESDGKIQRKLAQITFDGSNDEDWRIYGGARMSVSVNDFTAPSSSVRADLITDSGFDVVAKATMPTTASTTKYISGIDTGGHSLVVNVGTSTVEETRAYFASHPLTVIYPLTTPTTESATPYTNPQQVFSGGTEEFVDAGVVAQTRDVAVPVGHDSKYYLDIKGKVEQLYGIPEVPSTNGTYTLKATRSNSGVAYSWVTG